MSAPGATPDEGTLREFLLGALPPERAEPVVAWLSSDPSAAQALYQVAAHDLMTRVLADTTAVGSVPVPVVERIIRLVAKARAAADHSPAPPATPETVSSAVAPTSDPWARSDPSSSAPPGSPPQPAPALDELGRLAGRYQLFEKIGAGGMGTVFRARDETLDRPVALKMLPEGSAPDGGAVARFRREARALARLSHPGIVQAYDSGEDGGKHFLVMEYLEGHSLARESLDKGGLPPTRAADYAHQAALALHHAHQAGLVHRDVKPSNLLLASDGRVKVLDLGLARFLQDQVGDSMLTHAGAGMGTPDYCPPEQVRDAHKADVRSDVYALGCTLYHLIAGRVPFPGSSLSEKVQAHQTKEPPPLEESCPDLPAGLALVVQRMMAKRPQDRLQTMAEVAEALAPYVASSSPAFRAIRNTSAWSGAHLVIGRRRRVLGLRLAVGAAAALLLVAGGLMGLVAGGWFRPSASPLAQRFDTPSADTGKLALPLKEEPVDPNVLTVSQKPEGGGAYRTIAAALDAVKPGQTIRVLDDAVYRELLSLTRPSIHEGITLDAPRRAVIETATSRTNLVNISGVPGVTLRGFRLRADTVERCTLVMTHEDCSGLRLEGLEMSFIDSGTNSNIGFELHPRNGPRTNPPQAVLQGCQFQRCSIAVHLEGSAGSAVAGIAIRDGLFINCQTGVRLIGDVRRVQVAGNRFWGMERSAMQFELLSPSSEGIVLANNTSYDGPAFRLWDSAVKGKDVRVCNNLVLGGRGLDMHHVDAANESESRGPGDGAAVTRAYHFSHNWREGREPTGGDAKGWIPPDTKKGDVLKDRIDGVNRDEKSPNFLRPDKDSPLATEGAGEEDPLLPCYVGALPPEGVKPWDWDRTWRAVTKQAEDRK